MNVYADSTGHFVDRAVGKVTDLETGDKVADAVASAVEFVALIGIAIDSFLLGSARRRDCFAVGGAAALLGVLTGIEASGLDQRQTRC